MKKKKAVRPPRRLTVALILAWADAYFWRTGRWPVVRSGPVLEAPGLTWKGVDQALRCSCRGLPGGSSLAQLLAEARQVRNRARLPRLTQQLILSWVDDQFQRTCKWPNNMSGPVLAMRGETWQSIDNCLRQGLRGLKKGSSLARLLAQTGRKRNQMASLSVEQIVHWITSHQQRTEIWPHKYSGPVTDAPGETWLAIDARLQRGGRGLPRGSSLAKVILLYRNLLLRVDGEGCFWDGRVRVDSPARLVEIVILRKALLKSAHYKL